MVKVAPTHTIAEHGPFNNIHQVAPIWVQHPVECPLSRITGQSSTRNFL